MVYRWINRPDTVLRCKTPENLYDDLKTPSLDGKIANLAPNFEKKCDVNPYL